MVLVGILMGVCGFKSGFFWGMGGIGQEFVLERAALLRILSQEHMIGQYSIWKGRHWLELFLKRAAMVILLYEVGLIGQRSFWRGRDWLGFFWELLESVLQKDISAIETDLIGCFMTFKPTFYLGIVSA